MHFAVPRLLRRAEMPEEGGREGGRREGGENGEGGVRDGESTGECPRAGGLFSSLTWRVFISFA